MLDIIYIVQEFYALEAIAAMLSSEHYGKLIPMRHSHNRWHRDFTEFRNSYINKLASAIFDYTVMVVAAELRHCTDRASYGLREYFPSSSERNDIYFKCSCYRASDILEAGIRMFDTERVKWVRSYGGDKWKQIAKAGLMRGAVSDVVFIDHCVDLSHNNSVYFDKGAGIFKLRSIGEYQEFLSQKRYCEPELLVKTMQGASFSRLLWRANKLGIINVQATEAVDHENRSLSESGILDYQPIMWGTERLDYSENNIFYAGYIDSGYERRRECYSRNDDDLKKCA